MVVVLGGEVEAYDRLEVETSRNVFGRVERASLTRAPRVVAACPLVSLVCRIPAPHEHGSDFKSRTLEYKSCDGRVNTPGQPENGERSALFESLEV